MIDGLKDRSGDLSKDQSKGFISALLTLLSSLPDLKGELLDFGSDIEQIFLIKHLLLNLDVEERFEWFRNQLQTRSPLYASVHIVAYDLPRANEPRQEPIFSEEQLAVLKQICLERIELQAADGSIIAEKDFTFILYRWKDWTANRESIDDFTRRIRSTPTTFLDFLKGFVRESRSQSSDSYHIEVNRHIDVKGLSLFMNEEEINTALEMARGVDITLISPEQKEALNLLVEGLERKQQNNEAPE